MGTLSGFDSLSGCGACGGVCVRFRSRHACLAWTGVISSKVASVTSASCASVWDAGFRVPWFPVWFGSISSLSTTTTRVSIVLSSPSASAASWSALNQSCQFPSRLVLFLQVCVYQPIACFGLLPSSEVLSDFGSVPFSGTDRLNANE